MGINPALFKKCGVNKRGQAPIPRDAGQNIYYVCINMFSLVVMFKVF